MKEMKEKSFYLQENLQIARWFQNVEVGPQACMTLRQWMKL